MRQIKFRAWDESNNQMVYARISQNFGYGSLSDADILKRYEDVMQFTGLTDKNKAAIWEGDIVNFWVPCTATEWEREEYGEIIFKRGSFCIVNERRSVILEGKCKTDPLNKYFDCEVTGNIYENPELLNSEQKAQASVATDDHSSKGDG